MAGDLWAICHGFANPSIKKHLRDLYVDQKWTGRDFLDSLQDTYNRICESLDSSHESVGLPDKMTDLYNIEDSF